MGMTLTPLGPTPVPLEAECITPRHLAGLAAREAGRLPVWLGNEQRTLGEFFRIAGSGDGTVVIGGSAAHVKWIGRGMSGGRLEVHGDAGMHLGAGMTGGEIHVLGAAGDHLGAEMTGGVIQVHGDAGHLVGGAYRGSPRGMTGGTIVVHGSAGHEAGAYMGRGFIAVLGNLGDAAGIGMHAGTILCAGQLGARAGAWMRRGSVIGRRADLLPTFLYACRCRPAFLSLYLRWLAGLGIPVLPAWHAPCWLFSGDTAVGGKGEVLLWQSEPA